MNRPFISRSALVRDLFAIGLSGLQDVEAAGDQHTEAEAKRRRAIAEADELWSEGRVHRNVRPNREAE